MSVTGNYLKHNCEGTQEQKFLFRKITHAVGISDDDVLSFCQKRGTQGDFWERFADVCHGGNEQAESFVLAEFKKFGLCKKPLSSRGPAGLLLRFARAVGFF